MLATVTRTAARTIRHRCAVSAEEIRGAAPVLGRQEERVRRHVVRMRRMRNLSCSKRRASANKEDRGANLHRGSSAQIWRKLNIPSPGPSAFRCGETLFPQGCRKKRRGARKPYRGTECHYCIGTGRYRG